MSERRLTIDVPAIKEDGFELFAHSTHGFAVDEEKPRCLARGVDFGLPHQGILGVVGLECDAPRPQGANLVGVGKVLHVERDV